MKKSKKLIAVHKNLQSIYTGGQYALAQVIGHAQKKGYNIDVIDCSLLPKNATESRISLILHFTKYYLTQQRDIFTFVDHSLHFRFLIPLLISRFFGNKYGLHCNQTFYNFRASILEKSIEFLCEYLFLHAASLLVIPSTPSKNYFRRFCLPHNKFVVVNPAARVVPTRKSAFRRTARNILFVGQVKWWKGLDTLVKALGQSKHLNLNLDVAGIYDPDSKHFKHLMQLLHEYNIVGNVKFHGNLSTQALSDLYYNADIFVMPSHYETYGIVILEAIAHGLPVITSTIPSAKALIVENTNGLFFKKGDPEALARALHEICTNNTLRFTIHNNNVALSKHLKTWDSVAEETLHAIRKFLQ